MSAAKDDVFFVGPDWRETVYHQWTAHIAIGGGMFESRKCWVLPWLTSMRQTGGLSADCWELFGDIVLVWFDGGGLIRGRTSRRPGRVRHRDAFIAEGSAVTWR